MSCRATEIADVADIAKTRERRKSRDNHESHTSVSGHAKASLEAERKYGFGDVLLAHLLGLLVGAAVVCGLAVMFGFTARYLAHSG
jgi:hypothetical protein